MKKDDKEQKIWDMTFKTLLLETPKLFLPLIKEVFGKKYPRECEIIFLNNEFYKKDRTQIVADTTFRILDKNYHFECQSSKDDSMVFRMFEYDFHIGASEIIEKEDYLEFNFPKSCVVYVSSNKNHPALLQMKINYPNGTTSMYEVPTILVQEYTIAEIEKKDLELFMPFMIVRYRNKFRNKIKPTVKEIEQFMRELMETLNRAYYGHIINDKEYVAVAGAIGRTANYELDNYPDIWKGVDTMMTELLEIPELEAFKNMEKKVRQEAEQEAEQEKLNMLVDFYKEGVALPNIQKQARKQGITEQQLNEALKINK